MSIPHTTVITPPTQDDEPVTLDEVKLHLRIDGDDSEDAWLEHAISAARASAEDFLNRYIAPTTVEFREGCWPAWQVGQVLPGSDTSATIESVKYIDTDGEEQTLATDQYALTWGAPARLVNSYNQHWPQARIEPGAIRVQYKAGTEPDKVPKTIKQAILLTIGAWYENRENAVIGSTVAELPQGVKALLWPSRISLGV